MALARIQAQLREAGSAGDCDMCIGYIDLRGGGARFIPDPNRTIDRLRQGERKAIPGDSGWKVWLTGKSTVQSHKKQKGRHHPKLYG